MKPLMRIKLLHSVKYAYWYKGVEYKYISPKFYNIGGNKSSTSSHFTKMKAIYPGDEGCHSVPEPCFGGRVY